MFVSHLESCNAVTFTLLSCFPCVQLLQGEHLAGTFLPWFGKGDVFLLCAVMRTAPTHWSPQRPSGCLPSMQAEQSLVKCIELLLRPLAALVQAYQPQGKFPADDRRVATTATDGMHRAAMFTQHLSSCPSFIGGHLPHLWEFIVNFTSLASQQEAIVESSLKVIMCVPLCLLLLTSCFTQGRRTCLTS